MIKIAGRCQRKIRSGYGLRISDRVSKLDSRRMRTYTNVMYRFRCYVIVSTWRLMYYIKRMMSVASAAYLVYDLHTWPQELKHIVCMASCMSVKKIPPRALGLTLGDCVTISSSILHFGPL